jgi:hypothetical protein
MYVVRNVPGIGDIMAQSTAILGFLAVVLVLFIIVFVIMFIGYKRLGRLWRTRERTARNEPVIGTDRGPTSGPQQIHYCSTDNPMNQDIGGDLARVPPRQDKDTEDNSRRS